MEAVRPAIEAVQPAVARARRMIDEVCSPPPGPRPFSLCAAFCTVFSAIAVAVLLVLGWIFMRQPEFIPEVPEAQARGAGPQLWVAGLVYLAFALYCRPRIGGGPRWRGEFRRLEQQWEEEDASLLSRELMPTRDGALLRSPSGGEEDLAGPRYVSPRPVSPAGEEKGSSTGVGGAAGDGVRARPVAAGKVATGRLVSCDSD
jgi:hypothetical protein